MHVALPLRSALFLCAALCAAGMSSLLAVGPAIAFAGF